MSFDPVNVLAVFVALVVAVAGGIYFLFKRLRQKEIAEVVAAVGAVLVAVLIATIVLTTVMRIGQRSVSRPTAPTSVIPTSTVSLGRTTGPALTPTPTPTITPTPTPTPTPRPTPTPTATPAQAAVTDYYEEASPDGSPTFTNYTNAGGTMGQRVGDYETVEVSCRLTGWTAPSGDNWWYRLPASPWNNAFYTPADDFYNLPGYHTGSVSQGPYVDTSVPLC